MRKTKIERGITLIALIITIIVLLILAVVTIGSVKKNNIMGYAQNAATEYNKEKDKEESLLTGYEGMIEGALEGLGKATVGKKVQANSTIDGKMYSSKNPIIPAGFTPINITGDNASSWTAESGPETDKGLVIKDDDGNEFVWVPVTTTIAPYGIGGKVNEAREPDVTTGANSYVVDSASGEKNDAVADNLKRAGCTKDLNSDGKINAFDFKQQLTAEFETMAESVNKYCGFYIGRYETSKNGENPQSKASTAEKEIVTAYNSSKDNDWYGLYALNKKFTTTSVQGSMIWGNQYQAMISWIGKEKAESNIENKKNLLRTCGTASEDVVNNIYDLYGNSKEWTMEAYNLYYRVHRGGDYEESNTSTPSSRDVTTWPTNTYGQIGSRLALYIKN